MGSLQSVFQLFTKQHVATGSSCQGVRMTRKVMFMIKILAAEIAELARKNRLSLMCESDD